MAKDKKKNQPPNPAPPKPMYSQGAGPVPNIPSHGIPSQGMYAPPPPATGGLYDNMAMGVQSTTTLSPKDAKKNKKVKDKKASKNMPPQQPNLMSLTPEQMSQLQLEEAIRESQNPSMKLRRLKHPISWKSFFFSLLLFVVLTLAVAYIWIAISVDKFNFGHITADIMKKSGIGPAFVDFFTKLGHFLTGKGWKLVVTLI